MENFLLSARIHWQARRRLLGLPGSRFLHFGLTGLVVMVSACASLGQCVVGWGPSVGLMEPVGITNVIEISAGASHALGLRADGGVVAWGQNSFGETDVPADLNDAKAIAAGNHFSLALRRDGRLIQWGLNMNFETNFFSFPSDLVALSAGGSHALGLRGDGTVVAWGQNLYGEGNVPPDLSGVIAIAAGDNHSLALKSDGTVVGWGDNRLGQASVPFELPAVLAIAAGADHSLALTTDGSVIGWGNNSAGQITVPPGLKNAIAIAAGYQHSLAIASDESVVAWGQLGSAIPWDVSTAVGISTGGDLCLTLTTNFPPILPEQALQTVTELTELVVTNTAIYPGQPSATLTYELISAPEGASINTDGVIRWTPTEVQAQAVGTYAILTEVVNPIARRRNRKGFEILVHKLNAAPVLPPQPNRQVADFSELAITNTASDPNIPANHLTYELLDPPPAATIDAFGVIRWLPRAGQVPVTNVFTTVVIDDGVPPLSATNSFIVVLPVTNGSPVIISQPRSISVGIGRDATLSVEAVGAEPIQYQWQFMGTDLPGATTSSLSFTNAQVTQSGLYRVVLQNLYGTLASATVQVSVQGVVAWGWSSYEILNAPPTVTNVVALSAGKVHSLALRADGTVVAWGYNAYGECDVPPGLGDTIAVAAGNSHSLALKADGTVVGWGENFDGELNIPPDLVNAVAISTLQGSSFAIKADGTLVGWGNSNTGMPMDLTNVVAIAAGRDHNLVLKADGTLMAWGYYPGVGAPAYVPYGLTNVVAIAAGLAECLALRADGTVVAWSYDSAGGKLTRDIAVSNIVAISTFSSHSLALRDDGTVLQWGDVSMGDVPQPMDLRNVVAIAAGGYQSLALLRDGAPHLTVQPSDQTVPESARSFFAAKAVGLQGMSFQWQFKGKDIPGATRDIYSIPEARLADAGEYNLVASNPIGKLVSRRAKLNVLSTGANNTNTAPVILSLLSSANQIFQFQVSGDLGPDYIIEMSTALQTWTALQTNHPDSMPFVFTAPNVGSSSGFFRVRLRRAGY